MHPRVISTAELLAYYVCLRLASNEINFDFSMEESAASVVYNYKHGFSGFAAMLTPQQAKQLAGQHTPYNLNLSVLAFITV